MLERQISDVRRVVNVRFEIDTPTPLEIKLDRNFKTKSGQIWWRGVREPYVDVDVKTIFVLTDSSVFRTEPNSETGKYITHLNLVDKFI